MDANRIRKLHYPTPELIVDDDVRLIANFLLGTDIRHPSNKLHGVLFFLVYFNNDIKIETTIWNSGSWRASVLSSAMSDSPSIPAASGSKTIRGEILEQSANFEFLINHMLLAASGSHTKGADPDLTFNILIRTGTLAKIRLLKHSYEISKTIQSSINRITSLRNDFAHEYKPGYLYSNNEGKKKIQSFFEDVFTVTDYLKQEYLLYQPKLIENLIERIKA